MPRFHGHLKASLQPLSGVMKVTLPIETPVIHVPLSRRVGETLLTNLTAVGAEKTKPLTTSSRPITASGFAVIGPFEPMPPAPVSPRPAATSAGRRDTQTCKQLATRAG